MNTSLTDTLHRLLAGAQVQWTGTKAKSLTLATPGQRRLFAYLLDCDHEKLVQGDEALFDGLIAAWRDAAADPADQEVARSTASVDGPWRLHRIETTGFGGLNTPGGPAFVLDLDGENWCLEGHNGSGKTSLASAIIWAMTGYRCTDHHGPIREPGGRVPVRNSQGEKIGDWPSIVAYPASPADLAATARMSVRLTFRAPDGSEAEAARVLTAAPNSAARIGRTIDPRLQAQAELIEIGLLMPARIARIGFGAEKSKSIYDAVKLLTGLDRLDAIGEAVAIFTHKGRPFLKHAQARGIDAIVMRLDNALARAAEEGEAAGFDVSVATSRTDSAYADDLRAGADEASRRAAACLAQIEADLADTLDIAASRDRDRIAGAVAEAGVLAEGRGIATFESLTALRDAAAEEGLSPVSAALAEARAGLSEALGWHERQEQDRKLRLKALGAQFLEPGEGDPDCPLCAQPLSGEEGKALARELADLRANAVAAERRLEDVCAGLESRLRGAVPVGLLGHLDRLAPMQPRAALRAEIEARFAEGPPFATILTGIAAAVRADAAAFETRLPMFAPAEAPDDPPHPEPAAKLFESMRRFERIVLLADWWRENRQPFADAWLDLLGRAEGEGLYPAQSIKGRLGALQAALDQAAPLDQIASSLRTGADAAEAWLPIHEEQQLREEIAKALAPMRELRDFVSVETMRSISSLSERVKAVLSRIFFCERLSFAKLELGRKAVHVEGGLADDIRIDAAEIANSSWLRAILWAFVLAMREQAIEVAGGNAFPLMLLDDPQVTFDPRNKRKWAEELARLGNAAAGDPEAAQLVVITHERQFFQMLVNVEKLTGRQGLVARVYEADGVARVIRGDALEPAYQAALAGNDDQKGHGYVVAVRTYCEQLLKIMLRTEDPRDGTPLTIGPMTDIVKQRRTAGVAPYTNHSFGKLLDLLESKPMKNLNEAHHEYDGTVGLAQATDVRKFWRQLELKLHTCFKIFTAFEAHVGEPRLFAWMDNVVPFPAGGRDRVEALQMRQTGIAAAARTDGRAGDGLIEIRDLAEARAVKLHNHSAYQLTAGTLDPVADIGDVILVRNYGPINPRNLVVAAIETRLLARRYNEVELHPNIAVLTGQATDPTAIAQPMLAPKDRIEWRKIVGTVFVKKALPVPPIDDGAEFREIPDFAAVAALVENARLFQVDGRSAEPIALDGQYIMTRPCGATLPARERMNGRLVIAIDDAGARYFKRLRLRADFAVLESLNPDGTTPAELLGLDDRHGLPRLTDLLEVVGILFELPGD